MVQLAEVSWTDAQKLFSECDTVTLPVGSTEQHGPHTPWAPTTDSSRLQ